MDTREKPADIREYIDRCEKEVRERLLLIRAAIHEAAPDAEEVISYGMPAFKQGRVLVYFAAFKNHIGFYPTSSGITQFRDELKGLSFSKGAVQFAHDQPLPLKLVKRIVTFRLKEELELLKTKRNKK